MNSLFIQTAAKHTFLDSRVIQAAAATHDTSKTIPTITLPEQNKKEGKYQQKQSSTNLTEKISFSMSIMH